MRFSDWGEWLIAVYGSQPGGFEKVGVDMILRSRYGLLKSCML